MLGRSGEEHRKMNGNEEKMESFIGRSVDVVAIQEQHKRKFVFTVAVVVTILLCVLLGFAGYHWFVNREYTTYHITGSVSVKNAASLNYAAYQRGVIRYGRDGVTAVDGKGKSLWSGSYEMANPKLDTCGESAVVADVGGKSLYIYKGGDTGVDFTVDYPIVQACVSSQGIVAVLMEENASNTIALYNPFDKSDKLLVEIPTNVEDGYPVSLDLSSDGTSVVASYLCVTTGAAQSRVAFYNFSEVGKNTNSLVGAHNYNDILISEVRFMDEDHVCLFGEKGFYLWGNMKQPELIKKREFSQEIQSAFSDEEYIGILVKKDEENNTMKLYDTEGEETLSVSVDNIFSRGQIQGEEVILNTGSQCAIYRTNGVKKFSGSLKNAISYIFPGSGINRFILIQDSKIKFIKLG